MGLNEDEARTLYSSKYASYYPLNLQIYMNETDRQLTEALYADYYKSMLIQTPFDDMQNYD